MSVGWPYQKGVPECASTGRRAPLLPLANAAKGTAQCRRPQMLALISFPFGPDALPELRESLATAPDYLSFIPEWTTGVC